MGNVDWKLRAGAMVLAVVLATVLAGAAWLGIGRLRAERDLWALRAQSLARENAALAAEARAAAKALAGREAERARLAAENEALRGRLEDVYASDPESRAWADAPCPGAVLDCLRRQAGAARPAGGPAGRVPGGRARARVAGPDQRGPFGLGPGPAGGGAPGQRGQAGPAGVD